MSTSTTSAPAGARAPDLQRRRRFRRDRVMSRPASTEAAATTTPRWARLGFAAVLALAAVLTLWNLSNNGWSNTYYAAAVRSATESWKAWFFGSLDPGSFITVDKPPLSIWLMGLSTRIFGFSSFAMLMPQALCTVGAVALLHATVRRFAGHATALAAALALALTPITVAIGRVNNPDALLVLLLVASAYLLVRALESGRTAPLVWAGVAVGLAFMTKMLQGWMVLPALFGTYALFGPGGARRRAWQLGLATVSTVAVSIAWPLAVTLWPGRAPYIGGSTDGSAWDLILGYNGLGRIFGQGGGQGGGGANFGGEPGLLRLFNAQVGGQIAWLLPLAAGGLVLGLWATRRAPRTDLRRAGIVLFGLWAAVHVAIFSFAQGTFHPYYVSALAPAVAVLAAVAAVELTRLARGSWLGVALFDGAVVGSSALALALLGRTTDAPAWATVAVPVAAVVAVVTSPGLYLGARGRWPRLGAIAAIAATLAVLAGPASYSVANLGRSLSGNNVLAGPAGISAAGGMGGAPGAMGGSGGPPATGQAPAMPTMGSGMGGGSVSATLIDYLEAHQGAAKYLVAATGSQTTASIIIQTGAPVVTIGGFSGSDNAPTVAQLAAMVASGELRYVLVGGGGGPGGGQSAITEWVTEHGTAVTGVDAGNGTLYEVSA